MKVIRLHLNGEKSDDLKSVWAIIAYGIIVLCLIILSKAGII